MRRSDFSMSLVAAVVIVLSITVVVVHEFAKPKNPASARICVSPAYDDLSGDFLPEQIILVEARGMQTDDQSLYRTFIDHAESLVGGRRSTSDPEQLTMVMWFDAGSPGWRRSMGAAVLCAPSSMGDNHPCRNRTYFVFSREEPEVLAELMVRDILSEKPNLTECVLGPT